MNTETWKDIKGYEGLYQVSNCGNVRNRTRQITLKEHKAGYKQVLLFKNGKGNMFLVHRLVANAFIPNPLNLPVVNHIDENKKNNNSTNLEWCTVSENNQKYIENHEKDHGRKISIRTKVGQYTPNGELVKVWENPREIVKQMHMNQWSITECCKGNRHTAYGYKWKYIGLESEVPTLYDNAVEKPLKKIANDKKSH